MTTRDIMLRWTGPGDATSGSTYKIERNRGDGLTFEAGWTTLAAAQPATSPYDSPTGTLNGNHVYGDVSLVMDDASGLSGSGYGWLDGALVQWAGKSTNTLTGVVWHSGSGTYADGTTLYEAHEDYEDAGVSVDNYAVVYRITHQDANNNVSAPAYFWFYDPPTPASSDHCVVIINVATDLGVEPQNNIKTQAYLGANTQFGKGAGQHLEAQASTNVQQLTNMLGLAFFHCWHDARRKGSTGAVSTTYTFMLNVDGGNLAIASQSIPNRPWTLLKDIA